MTAQIGVLGGGSFGTALANVLAENGHDVVLYCRREDQRDEIRHAHTNARFFPDLHLSPALQATCDLREAVIGRPVVVSAVPTQSTREVLTEVRPHLLEDAVITSASKGLELGSLALLSQVFEEALPDHRACYFSGPSFARELITRHPTAATVASRDEDAARLVQGVFGNEYLRIYTSQDVIGVEVAGAVKNIMAIAAGISDALGFGHNTRAALITRGLAEITRLGLRLGAHQGTFMGLSGLGDLVLTCTGDLSRNRRVGLGIGAGKSLDAVLAEMKQVAEGVPTTRAVRQLAHQIGVEMPIVEEVYLTLYEGKSPRQAVVDLMLRPVKAEAR